MIGTFLSFHFLDFLREAASMMVWSWECLVIIIY